MVALTFDDGPYRGPTEAILAALRSVGAQATFFVVGERAAAAPELIASALEQGHAVEPHCHSVLHRSHLELAAGDIRADIEQALATLSALDVPPPRFWRPPDGDIKDPDSYEVAAEHGLALVTWTVQTCDWQGRLARPMLHDLRRPDRRDGALRDDSVVLMHDMPETAKLVPMLADELHARGYSLGALPAENPAVATRGEYHYGRLDGREPCRGAKG